MSDLDKPGDWKIKVTIYRNGRRVGFTDTEGHETYDQAAYWVGEALATREIDGLTIRSGKPTATNGGDA